MRSLIFRLTGIVIFIYLLVWVVDIQELGDILGSMSLILLLAVIPLHFFQWTLRVLRWRILLQNETISLSVLEIYATAAAGFFLGCLTPGRLGEFGKVKFLMNAGFPFRGAFMSSLLERLLDLVTLGIYVVFGIGICLPLLGDKVFVSTTLLVSVLVIFILGARYRSILKKTFLKLIPESLAGSVERKIQIFIESLRSISRKQWGLIVFYSLGVWGLNYGMIYFLFSGTGFSLPLHYAFGFAALGSLAGLLPISVYGMGIREALLIGLFLLLGYSKEEAETAGMVLGLMFVVLLGYHIVWGFGWWMSPVMKRFLTSKKE